MPSPPNVPAIHATNAPLGETGISFRSSEIKANDVLDGLTFTLCAGEKYLAVRRWETGDDGPPMLVRHEPCGALIEAVPSCSSCGERLTVADLTPIPGPGFKQGPDTAEVTAALERLAAARLAA